ncbi:MAG: large-conductance mechanosensitive channel protein MscL [SAR324 cluster bacterium]|uniref:Large-conductance mechanosensitive channel n=1 Tax=SAR324 cluster bacterium TaxID=2024889 RepID=A0A7X9FUC4_9DELT|nr:large-conductance mechanosensitive channel protein MscL [SAR324 cluster bacterium]
MGLIKEFKEFAMKGNVVDMAVGLIVGAAFGKIVSSLVADVLMPPIGLLLGGVDFKDLKLTMAEASGSTPAVTLNYGAFIQTTIDFIIIAAAVFLLIKAINTLKRSKEEAPAPEAPSKQEILLAEIRDLLKSK